MWSRRSIDPCGVGGAISAPAAAGAEHVTARAHLMFYQRAGPALGTPASRETFCTPLSFSKPVDCFNVIS